MQPTWIGGVSVRAHVLCFLVCVSKLYYANVCVCVCPFAYVNVKCKNLKGHSVDATHQHQFTHQWPVQLSL